ATGECLTLVGRGEQHRVALLASPSCPIENAKRSSGFDERTHTATCASSRRVRVDHLLAAERLAVVARDGQEDSAPRFTLLIVRWTGMPRCVHITLPVCCYRSSTVEIAR